MNWSCNARTQDWIWLCQMIAFNIIWLKRRPMTQKQMNLSASISEYQSASLLFNMKNKNSKCLQKIKQKQKDCILSNCHYYKSLNSIGPGDIPFIYTRCQLQTCSQLQMCKSFLYSFIQYSLCCFCFYKEFFKDEHFKN